MGLRRTNPVFDAVATGPDGHGHMGDSGSGHYVKMVHNGVEYALMQAYGEGFELLADGRYDLDLESVAKTWNNGAVIRSWLLELCEEAFREEGSDLGDVDDHVAGGSTGTWTVQEALEQEVPVPLIYQSLAERFGSRADDVASRAASPADSGTASVVTRSHDGSSPAADCGCLGAPVLAVGISSSGVQMA